MVQTGNQYRIESWSVSRDNAYYRCPYRYSQTYGGEAVKEQTEAMAMGSLLHECIAEYYDRVDVKYIWEETEDELIFDYIIGLFRSIISDDDLVMHVVSVVVGFTDIECDRIEGLKSKSDSLERFERFYLPVIKEEKYERETVWTVKEGGEEHQIRTTMRMIPDAIYRNGDGTHIVVDWKTGWSKAKLDGEVNRQLYVYAHFLEFMGIKDNEGNPINVDQLCVVYPRRAAVLVKDRSSRAEKTILNWMGKRLLALAREEFPRKPGKMKCGWGRPPEKRCQFLMICRPILEEEGVEVNLIEDMEGMEIDDSDEEEYLGEEERDEESVVIRDFSEGDWDTIQDPSLGRG